MNEVIRTTCLSKNYGSVRAADSVDLEIKQGEIYGFLGLNGAGKTTTIRMLLGMIKPSGGQVYLFGKKPDQEDGKLWNRLGYMVEIPYSYPDLTVYENLEIFRQLRFLKDKKVIDDIIENLYLGPYREVKAKNLSLGNAQRLGIAKAMIHHPDLLILDEPANGLDPSGIVQVRELLIDLAENHGVTIFISSHILGEISKLASRIGIINNGKLIRESDTHQLKADRKRILHVSTLDNMKATGLLGNSGYSPAVLPDGSIELDSTEALDHPEKISSLLVNNDLPPTRVAIDEEDLEHYFFRIIKENKSIS